MLFDQLREACNLAFLDGENITVILNGMAYIVQMNPLTGVLRCYLLASPTTTPELTDEMFKALGLMHATPSKISVRYFKTEVLDAD